VSLLQIVKVRVEVVTRTLQLLQLHRNIETEAARVREAVVEPAHLRPSRGPNQIHDRPSAPETLWKRKSNELANANETIFRVLPQLNVEELEAPHHHILIASPSLSD